VCSHLVHCQGIPYLNYEQPAVCSICCYFLFNNLGNLLVGKFNYYLGLIIFSVLLLLIYPDMSPYELFFNYVCYCLDLVRYLAAFRVTSGCFFHW